MGQFERARRRGRVRNESMQRFEMQKEREGKGKEGRKDGRVKATYRNADGCVNSRRINVFTLGRRDELCVTSLRGSNAAFTPYLLVGHTT